MKKRCHQHSLTHHNGESSVRYTAEQMTNPAANTDAMSSQLMTVPTTSLLLDLCYL